MITVDRPTERRNAVIQYLIQSATLIALSWFLADDKRYVAVLAGPLLVLTAYRSVNVERLSPRLADYYAHAVVAGAADAMLREFAADRWLHDSWAAAGAPLAELRMLTPDRLVAARGELTAAGPPPRTTGAAARAANRAAALVIGVLLGGPLGWALGHGGFALPWPLVVAPVLVVIFRLAVARHNGRQTDRVAAAMRANTRAELAALLAPPWTDRRVAVVGELRRLLVIGPARPPTAELRTIELLLAAGIAAGLATGLILR